MPQEVSLSKPWYMYTEAEINQHMAEHSTGGKKYGFCGFDLELSYLLGHSTRDFQAICSNRIILASKANGVNPTGLRSTLHIPNKIYDAMPVKRDDLSYQAQNLVYMYALGIVETLDKPLIRDIRNANVDNSDRSEGDRLDGILPIFREAIGMKSGICIDEVENIREYYVSKRPIADEIRRIGRTFQLRFKGLTLQEIQKKSISEISALL